MDVPSSGGNAEWAKWNFAVCNYRGDFFTLHEPILAWRLYAICMLHVEVRYGTKTDFFCLHPSWKHAISTLLFRFKNTLWSFDLQRARTSCQFVRIAEVWQSLMRTKHTEIASNRRSSKTERICFLSKEAFNLQKEPCSTLPQPCLWTTGHKHSCSLQQREGNESELVSWVQICQQDSHRKLVTNWERVAKTIKNPRKGTAIRRAW